MAQLQRFIIPNIRPNGRQIGVGSYGSVEEFEFSGTVCAGKKIHETLVDQGNLGRQNITRKYVEECQLMSDLRHPNLVQFWGLCFLPDSSLPVLVMERLLMSLDDLLEHTPDIPLAVKMSVMLDIARGLVYLHTHDPVIIHRDLSAKNILLNSAMMAKISDLGNSRIVDIQPGQVARTLSCLPGTMVYMPPEAFDETSRYGTSLDVFSFGHLSLFTLTQDFPGTLLPSTYPDPDDPTRILARSEAERRHRYIDLLRQQENPLVDMVTDCLQNAPSLRPSAEEVLHLLEGVKRRILDPYGHMNKLEMMQALQEKDDVIENHDGTQSRNQASLLQVSTTLECTELARIPTPQCGAQATLFEQKVYIGRGWTTALLREELTEFYMYENMTNSWQVCYTNHDHHTPRAYSTIAAYDGHLAIVGGLLKSTGKPTPTVTISNANGQGHSLPPLPTPRCSTAVLGDGSHLIVAGGWNNNLDDCSTVEIYSAEQQRWLTAESLPQPCSFMKSVYLHGKWYLSGGNNQGRIVMYASVRNLIASTSSSPSPSVWKTLPELPCEYSSVAVFGGCLVAVGGLCHDSSSDSTLYVYSPHTRVWLAAATLPVPVSMTCTITLPNGELLLIGGVTPSSNQSSQVYKLSLKQH